MGGNSERLGFVDEHDGDAVLDRVHEAAGSADQRLGRLAILELAFAPGADENLQQLGGQCHGVSVAGKPNRASAAAFFRQLGSTLTQVSR